MYERILIPLDGSQLSESALPHVEDLVSKLSPETKVEVTLLQVLSPVKPRYVGGARFRMLSTLRHRRKKARGKLLTTLIRLVNL
jgi:hypothetical protein